MIRGRLRRRGGDEDDDLVEIDPSELTGLFAAPGWLRDAGFTSWLLVGVTLLLAGLVWILSLTHTIVLPLVTAGIVAAVASPIVARLQRRRVPRGIGAALLMIGIIVVGLGVFVAIVTGIASESEGLGAALSGAADEIEGWLKDIGVDPSTAQDAKSDGSSTVSDSTHALLEGVAGGIEALSSLVFFCALTALSLFFMLKDGPTIRAWGERRLGVPKDVAQLITGRVLQSLRQYFAGVTVVALFNGVVVGAGALILGVPLAGTIAAVTFFAAYVPYIGAWSAGAFSVLMALGGAGPDAAAGMVVVQLLANGLLQQMVQPIAYGAALSLHPLAVLVVTIAGGALFGAVGLILAAPLTAAVVRIAADLSADENAGRGKAPEPAPA